MCRGRGEIKDGKFLVFCEPCDGEGFLMLTDTEFAEQQRKVEAAKAEAEAAKLRAEEEAADAARKAAEAEAAARGNAPRLFLMSQQLSELWLELSFVLIKKVTSDADVVATEEALALGLAVLTEVQTIADGTGIRRGAIVQSLLPFNTETSASDQADVTVAGEGGEGGDKAAAALDEMAEKAYAALLASEAGKDLEAKFDRATHRRLLEGAVALRKLLRIKLADDADMDMAVQSVQEAVGFFDFLKAFSAQCEKTPFAVLCSLSESRAPAAAAAAAATAATAAADTAAGAAAAADETMA